MRRIVTTWDRSIGKQEFSLFVNEPGPADGGVIDYYSYDTFISHKGDDLELAEQIGGMLYACGVSGYLDHWDPEVDGDSVELETHLRKVIRIAPSILAVVTENTSESWWVPFELGVARETESQIATFLRISEESDDEVVLPSYLRNWPIIASMYELRQWATTLARTREVTSSGRTIFKSVSMSADSYVGREVDRLESAGRVRFD